MNMRVSLKKKYYVYGMKGTACACVFFAVAQIYWLYYYSVHAPSWLYTLFYGTTVASSGGGAQYAATMRYLLGSSAWCTAGILLYISYVLFMRIALPVWRCVLLFLLPFISACWCHVFQVGAVQRGIAGGLFGRLLGNFVTMCVGVEYGSYFISLCFFSMIMVATELYIVRWACQGVQRILLFMRRRTKKRSVLHGAVRERKSKNNQQKDIPFDNVSLPRLASKTVDTSLYDDEYDGGIRAKTLEEKLARFGIAGIVVDIKKGPVVTLFEYQPSADTKLSKIIALEDDLAMALQAMSIRIIAPIPGKSVVGFEITNTHRVPVFFASLLHAESYEKGVQRLPLIFGVNTTGAPVIVDLARLPHLLIAGSTGSGKSVALNAMITSLLCKRTHEELRLILIDPKRLEFTVYADIPHLLFPLVTDPRKAIPVMRWVVKHMEERYVLMAASGVRNIEEYNAKIPNGLPYMVIIIDELADLMMSVGRDIEDLITRVAQMARAAGIHMIVATQRPSVDVITGLIKVNFPSRISFRVTSRIDSRTILDCAGAEKLIGNGDMLFLDAHAPHLERLHGAYITQQEMSSVVDHIKMYHGPSYIEGAAELAENTESSYAQDPLYHDIITFLESVDDVSISLLQRKFHIGYNRSARIIDHLETQGRIMPSDGGKTRKVIR